MGEDDDSIIEVPQELKEPDIIVIDDEEGDEEVPAAHTDPNSIPVNSSGDHGYSLPFATWGKAKDHKLGEPMLGHIYFCLDKREPD